MAFLGPGEHSVTTFVVSCWHLCVPARGLEPLESEDCGQVPVYTQAQAPVLSPKVKPATCPCRRGTRGGQGQVRLAPGILV